MTGASTTSTPSSATPELGEHQLAERRLVERELAALGEAPLDAGDLRVLEGREEDAVAFARSLARLASASGGVDLDELALARARRRIESTRGGPSGRPAAVMVALAVAAGLVMLPRALLESARGGPATTTAAELNGLRQVVRRELDRLDAGPPGARTRELAERLPREGGAPP
jgi:hypothetical protein